jgi:hypothetical protein
VLILSDRNAYGNQTTGDYGTVGSGLEQRLYGVTDALGNTTAVLDAQGQLSVLMHDARTDREHPRTPW